MTILQDNHSIDDTSAAGFTTTVWRAMTFTVGSGFTIGRVKLKLYTLVVPDFVVVSIRATDGTIPIGPDLAYGEITGTDLATSSPGSWVGVSLGAGCVLSTATKYAIVCRTKTSGTCEWRLDISGTPGYAFGSRCDSANGGVDWIEGTTIHDYMFECYSFPNYSRDPEIQAVNAPNDPQFINHNLLWRDNSSSGGFIGWESKDGIEPILIFYNDEVYEIDEGETDYEFVFFDVNQTPSSEGTYAFDGTDTEEDINIEGYFPLVRNDSGEVDAAWGMRIVYTQKLTKEAISGDNLASSARTAEGWSTRETPLYAAKLPTITVYHENSILSLGGVIALHTVIALTNDAEAEREGYVCLCLWNDGLEEFEEIIGTGQFIDLFAGNKENFPGEHHISSRGLGSYLHYKGQGFTAESSYTITRIDLHLWKGGPYDVGDIDVKLYAMDDDPEHWPTGPVLASGTIASDAISADDYNWVSCILDVTHAIEDGEKYVITVNGQGTSGTKLVYFDYYDDGAGGSAYAGGVTIYSVNGGTVWPDIPNEDLPFKCYSDEASTGDLTLEHVMESPGIEEVRIAVGIGCTEEADVVKGTSCSLYISENV